MNKKHIKVERKVNICIACIIFLLLGPAKTPEGMISGSFGPTTAGRMDMYVPKFMSKGASLITLAKGNRSKEVADACRQYKGVYLGAIGGPAAIIAQNCIKDVQLVEYPELGMEVYLLGFRL